MMQLHGHESPRERSFRWNRAVRSDMMAVWPGDDETDSPGLSLPVL